MRSKLADLETGFKQYQKAVAEILGNMQRLVNAKRATRDIFNDSETLLKSADALDEGYGGEVAARQVNYAVMAGASLLALLMLLTGAVTGAAVVCVLLRRRYLAVEQDFDGVSARLSEVSAQFAATRSPTQCQATEGLGLM